MTKAKRTPTKTTRIRRMLDIGAPVKDICKRLNVSPQFVYSVRYKDRALIAKKVKPVAKSSVAPKHVTPPQPYRITENKLPYGVEQSPEPVGVFSLITKYLRKWFA